MLIARFDLAKMLLYFSTWVVKFFDPKMYSMITIGYAIDLEHECNVTDCKFSFAGIVEFCFLI